MEPITACVALTDAIVGYFFWILVGRPWDLDSWRSYFYEREVKRQLRKLNLNEKDFENLKASKKVILEKLMNEH